MNEEVIRKRTLQRAGKKFYGHEYLYSKYTPQIPMSAEREYIRMTNEYMRLLKEELEENLPKLKKSYKENRDELVAENRRADAATDLMLMVSNLFTQMKSNLIKKTTGFGLRRRLESLANLNRKLTVKEWKRAIKATLGIDIREDYYLGEFYKEQLLQWVKENVDLISTIPEDTLDKMQDIVYDGYVNGRTTTQMVKDIQRVYGVSKRHATLIARDQTAKLNGQIQKYQQMDAGIEEYIWCTTGDERVRKSHQELNGMKFRWDTPPENSDGRTCNPGEDYQCRCIGRPVFKKSTLNLPMEDDSVQISIKNGG
jgi:SPP1 gp7 family putative phage head morphogenesis protein